MTRETASQAAAKIAAMRGGGAVRRRYLLAGLPRASSTSALLLCVALCAALAPGAVTAQRSGGAGVYYHFDYHGGPRSYQWINTNPIAKIWDQMSLAKQ